jgi:hypothetical protein
MLMENVSETSDFPPKEACLVTQETFSMIWIYFGDFSQFETEDLREISWRHHA